MHAEEQGQRRQVFTRIYGESEPCWAPIEVVNDRDGCQRVVGEPDPATELCPGELVRCVTRELETGPVSAVRCQVLPGGVERYRIDGRVIRTEYDFHDEIADSLGFFAGYGANLDALWDTLTDDSGMKWAQEPFEVLWLDSRRSRQALARFSGIVELFRSVRAAGHQIELLLDEHLVKNGSGVPGTLT